MLGGDLSDPDEVRVELASAKFSCFAKASDDLGLEVRLLEPAEIESIEDSEAPFMCRLARLAVEPILSGRLISPSASPGRAPMIEVGRMTCDAPFLYERCMLPFVGLDGLKFGM